MSQLELDLKSCACGAKPKKLRELSEWSGLIEFGCPKCRLHVLAKDEDTGRKIWNSTNRRWRKMTEEQLKGTGAKSGHELVVVE